MAHGLIAQATFEDQVDDLAFVWLNKETIQVSGVPRYLALSADDNADLTASGVEEAGRVLDDKLEAAEWYNTLFTPYLNALVRHLQAAAVTDTAKTEYAGIDEYLVGEEIRVHIAFADVFYQFTGEVSRLTAAQVFDAADVSMGTCAWSGVGAGTFTDGSAIDSNAGGNSLAVRVTATAGDDMTGVITATCTKPDETSEDKEITITSKVVGDIIDIGTHYDDIYTDVTTVSFDSGGANGDAVIIETVCDRDAALLS